MKTQHSTDNYLIASQMYALKALNRLAPSVYTCASIYEYGGFQGIANSLQANVGSEEVAAVAVPILSVLSFVSDCKAVATDGVIVDAVLYAMLEHSGNAMISQSGREVLDNLATDADAERHVNDLESALSNAASNSEGALKALAAAAGLSRVQRLIPTFENANVAKKILTVSCDRGVQIISLLIVGSAIIHSTLEGLWIVLDLSVQSPFRWLVRS